MQRVIIIAIIILVMAGGLILIQSFYFAPKENAIEKGARILFESKVEANKELVLEKIKKELLENEQFKNLGKNGDWPLNIEKLIKDKALPFVKATQK